MNYTQEQIDSFIGNATTPLTAEIEALKREKAEAVKAYETVKEWAHRLEGEIIAIIEKCDEHADGAPDATELGKFANELIGIYNSVAIGTVRNVVKDRDSLRLQVRVLREALEEFASGKNWKVLRGASCWHTNQEIPQQIATEALSSTPNLTAFIPVAVADELAGLLTEMEASMKSYQMNVDMEPPHRHRDMMTRTQQALIAYQQTKAKEGK